MHEQLTEDKHRWLNGVALGWLVLCIDGWTKSSTVGWMDRWMEWHWYERTDTQTHTGMDGWRDGW